MKWYWILAIVLGGVLIGFLISKARQRAILQIARLRKQKEIMDEIAKIDSQIGDPNSRIISETRVRLQDRRKQLIELLRQVGAGVYCCSDPNCTVSGDRCRCKDAQGATFYTAAGICPPDSASSSK